MPDHRRLFQGGTPSGFALKGEKCFLLPQLGLAAQASLKIRSYGMLEFRNNLLSLGNGYFASRGKISCVLSNLSYSADLALTLMRACMRGARACARSYMSRRGSEIKLTACT